MCGLDTSTRSGAVIASRAVFRRDPLAKVRDILARPDVPYGVNGWVVVMLTTGVLACRCTTRWYRVGSPPVFTRTQSVRELRDLARRALGCVVSCKLIVWVGCCSFYSLKK